MSVAVQTEREFEMLKEKFAAGTIAVVLSAFSFGLLGTTADAVTPVATGISITEPSNIQLAYMKRKVEVRRHGHKSWAYGRRHGGKAWVYGPKYGHRYRYRHPGYG